MIGQESIAPHVYTAISAVQAELAKTGIAKSRSNEQQHYKFRGIDEVYNVLSALLAQHKLVILPIGQEVNQVERVSGKGNALFYTTVTMDFDFVSAVDGSTHRCRTFGEAMDTADKSTNKAMSAAMKYLCLMSFAIPTEGDNDADATTHEVQKFDPWTAKLRVEANAEARKGLDAYGQWWKAQTKKFREDAVETELHANYKVIAAAIAVAVGATKDAMVPAMVVSNAAN